MIGIEIPDFFVNEWSHFPDEVKIYKDEFQLPYKLVFIFNTKFDFVVAIEERENGSEVVYESASNKWHKTGISIGVNRIDIDTDTDVVSITEKTFEQFIF